MGDATELILDGVVCDVCGEAFDGDAVGYPRTCLVCKGDSNGERRRGGKRSSKTFAEFDKLADAFGLKARECHETHWQARPREGSGPLLNYWPTRSRYSVEVKGRAGGKARTGTPMAAINAMLAEIDRGGAPRPPEDHTEIELPVVMRGLSQLDYIATAAMQGLLANPEWRPSPDVTSKIAYDYAEAMLAESRRRREGGGA